MTLAEMKRRYEAGETLAQIARVAGCVPSTVRRSLVTVLGMQLRKRGGKNQWPWITKAQKLERRDRIVDLYYEHGLTCAEIGRLIGRSHQTVWAALCAVGLPRRPAHGGDPRRRMAL